MWIATNYWQVAAENFKNTEFGKMKPVNIRIRDTKQPIHFRRTKKYQSQTTRTKLLHGFGR
jgi:hypothetical protein